MSPERVDYLRPVATPDEDGGWMHAWAIALAELEVGLGEAEAMLREDHALAAARGGLLDRWLPPVGLGPLPAQLQARASALLERQIEVSRQLAEAVALSRRHLDAVTTMRAAAPRVPVYLDTVG